MRGKKRRHVTHGVVGVEEGVLGGGVELATGVEVTGGVDDGGTTGVELVTGSGVVVGGGTVIWPLSVTCLSLKRPPLPISNFLARMFSVGKAPNL